MMPWPSIMRLRIPALSSGPDNHLRQCFVPQATRNALLLSEQAHYCVDVAEGAAQPLVQSLNRHRIMCMARGVWYVPVKQPYGMQVEMSAADYIVKKCRQHSGEVILCPVGPLTNIAAALKADPELVNHVQKVVIMGGAVWSPGNVSAYAEANIWNDHMQQMKYLQLIGTLILLVWT